MPRQSRTLFVAAAATAAALASATFPQPEEPVDQCPGEIDVQGVGRLKVLATAKNMPWFNAGPVDVDSSLNSISPRMWGRAYLANACVDGEISNEQYEAWQLLGKTVTYTTYLAGAGCGCNVAFYLVSMKQNPEVSGCDDYYCDANSVCGIRCAEIDVQEANRKAWHSALHIAEDGGGVAQGLGGWVIDNKYDMSEQEYGPGGRCIDTNSPFQVSVSFPVNAEGNLQSMDMKLSQEGKPCQVDYSMNSYYKDEDFEQLTLALREGMTPVMSYWKAEDMLWLDGPGIGSGLCTKDEEAASCAEGVSFSDFHLVDTDAFYP